MAFVSASSDITDDQKIYGRYSRRLVYTLQAGDVIFPLLTDRRTSEIRIQISPKPAGQAVFRGSYQARELDPVSEVIDFVDWPLGRVTTTSADILFPLHWVSAECFSGTVQVDLWLWGE